MKKIAILVGGGPAPGINGVIRSVTIEAINSGVEVYGCLDGFLHLMKGDSSSFLPLDIPKVSRIHHLGGSILRTSRANPLQEKNGLETVLHTLAQQKIEGLVTIGGDGTAYISSQVAATNKIAVVHVPKTIDNDIPLPDLIPTFGFHTARHYGTEIVKALMEDAKTTSRWYFLVTMGRKAGHLALGIGKAAGVPLTLIGEEFNGKKVTLQDYARILEGAILKRKMMGRKDGVAVLAEGLIEKLDLSHLPEAQKDKYGHIRFSEIDLGGLLKNEVKKNLKELNLDYTIVSKNIGYELRSMPPIPFDCEYTQDLGYAAMRFLIQGNSGAIMTIKRGGKMTPLYFSEIVSSQRMKVREFDISSDSYICARNYMIRLEKSDLENPPILSELAALTPLTPHDFKKRFETSIF